MQSQEPSLQYPSSFNPWGNPQCRGKILFVGGIPLDCTAGELVSFLAQYDEVSWLRIEEDPHSGIRKGYAFAMLQNPEGYTRILGQRHHSLRGLKIGISLWKDPKEYLNEKDKIMRRKVFVKRLHASVSDADLYSYFSAFGPLEKAEIRRSHLDNTSRRIGYVIFEREEDAARCLDVRMHLMNGREIICKKCKNATEARKEKLNKSNANDTFDSSRYHSMTYSNDSSRNNHGENSFLTNSANNGGQFNSMLVGGAEEPGSFYHSGSGFLNQTARANNSFSQDCWLRGIEPIEERDEGGPDIPLLARLGIGPANIDPPNPPSFQELALPNEVTNDFLEWPGLAGLVVPDRPVRMEIQIPFYTFPGYI